MGCAGTDKPNKQSKTDHQCNMECRCKAPLVMTSAIWEYVITGSPGTCRLPVHMNVHLPAIVAYAETRLVLLELSMLTILMFTLTPSWFSICVTPLGDVELQLTILDMFTA